MKVEFRLAGMTHCDPSEILAEAYVVAGFEAQDVGVEGKSVIEIGDPDADEGDVGDHDCMVRRGAVGRLLLGCDCALEISAHEEVTARNSRRVAAVPILKRPWRFTNDLRETAAERTKAAVTHREADLRNAEVRRTEQVLRPFDSALRQVHRRRSAVGGREKAVKMVFGECCHRREVGKSQGVGKVPIGMISCSAQLEERMVSLVTRTIFMRRCRC